MKEKNELFSFDKINAENLEQLFLNEGMSDRRIAELFDVTKSQVGYRRRKEGINLRKESIDKLFDNKTEDAKQLNNQFKNTVFTEENLSKVAIAITHFVFRNGPVEAMHAHPNSQLSNEDMKTLNKFIVNRLAYIFELIMNEKWIEFNFVIEQFELFGSDWDEAIPDDGDIKDVLSNRLK